MPDRRHSAKIIFFFKKNFFTEVTLGRELKKIKKIYFAECRIGGTRQRRNFTPPAQRTVTLTHSLFTVSPQPPPLWSAFPLPLPLSRRPRARGIGHGGPPASSRKLPAPAAVLSCCRYRPTHGGDWHKPWRRLAQAARPPLAPTPATSRSS